MSAHDTQTRCPLAALRTRGGPAEAPEYQTPLRAIRIVQGPDRDTDTSLVEVLTSTTLDRARQIVQHAHAISPSASLLRLEQQLRQGDSNARQLARLIDGSPALAARVLRMANSAFYAPAEPVTTLSRAVALLGDTVLRQLTENLNTVVDR
ncbi:MAG: HDOD domain-containing protein [Candidatus Limnocylindrales bacterium]